MDPSVVGMTGHINKILHPHSVRVRLVIATYRTRTKCHTGNEESGIAEFDFINCCCRRYKILAC